MSIFKPVKRAMDLRVGKKYIDVKHRRVVVVDEAYVSRGCVECHDVDDIVIIVVNNLKPNIIYGQL